MLFLDVIIYVGFLFLFVCFWFGFGFVDFAVVLLISVYFFILFCFTVFFLNKYIKRINCFVIRIEDNILEWPVLLSLFAFLNRFTLTLMSITMKIMSILIWLMRSFKAKAWRAKCWSTNETRMLSKVERTWIKQRKRERFASKLFVEKLMIYHLLKTWRTGFRLAFRVRWREQKKFAPSLTNDAIFHATLNSLYKKKLKKKKNNPRFKLVFFVC